MIALLYHGNVFISCDENDKILIKLSLSKQITKTPRSMPCDWHNQEDVMTLHNQSCHEINFNKF